MSNVKINISAPGKVILHGEHSVVYGKLALAASLGLRTRLEFCEEEQGEGPKTATVEFAALGLVHFYSLEDIQGLLDKAIPLLKTSSSYNYTHPEIVSRDEALSSIVEFIREKSGFDSMKPNQEQALVAFFYLFWAILGPVDLELKPFRLKVETELTVSAGTGSSASFAVTLAAFLIQLIRVKRAKAKGGYKSFKLDGKIDVFDKADLELISKWAFQSEKIIHGTPSGVDNTVCTYGSLVEFRKGSAPKLVALTTKFNLILIDTEVPRDTKTLVANVAAMRDKHKMIVDGVLELMDLTAMRALECIKKVNSGTGDEFEVMGAYETLEELADINQDLLRCLRVSHPKLDIACHMLAKKNLHGKLTGAGGGGFAFCLIPPYVKKAVVEKTIADLNNGGLVAVLTDLGGTGVSID